MRGVALCRLFLSAEPPPALERGLPINLLQNSIKLTNEPPEGLRPNLIRAFNSFNEEMLESCAKQVRLKIQQAAYRGRLHQQFIQRNVTGLSKI
jgi:hypothetical protein